jgi:hypothetical protein
MGTRRNNITICGLNLEEIDQATAAALKDSDPHLCATSLRSYAEIAVLVMKKRPYSVDIARVIDRWLGTKIQGEERSHHTVRGSPRAGNPVR